MNTNNDNNTPPLLPLEQQLERALRDGDLDRVSSILFFLSPSSSSFSSSAALDLMAVTFGTQGFSPLMVAARYGHTDICAHLLSLPYIQLDVNQRDALGSTALKKACVGGHVAIVSLLLEQGADVCLASDTLKFTPLMEAVLYRRTECVRVLVEHALKKFASSSSSSSAVGHGSDDEDDDDFIHIHHPNHKKEANEKKLNLFLNARNMRGQTALYMAAREGMMEEARLLLEAGASPFVCDLDGLSPLIPARVQAQSNCMIELLEAAMKEPERAWVLAKGRVVVEAREVVRQILKGEGKKEEDKKEEEETETMKMGKVKEQEEGEREKKMPKVLHSIPACVLRRVMGVAHEVEIGEETDVLLRLEEVLPLLERKPQQQQEKEDERLQATLEFVLEGGLKEELFVELREYMSVRYDTAAWGGVVNEMVEEGEEEEEA
jgi:ankyrin repeat protein